MRIAAVRLSPTGYRWLQFQDPVRLTAIGPIVKRRQRHSRRKGWSEAAWEARRAMSAIPYADRQALADEYADTGITLQELGDRYGLTRERIRQIIKDTDPTAGRRRRQRRDREAAEALAVEEWQELQKRVRDALTNNRVCVVCESWILRRAVSTCSTECSKVWTVLRHVDDPEHHRREVARTYLAQPEKYDTNGRLEWARSVLGPNPPPRNRTYLIPGSQRAEIVRKYRPELYAELTGAEL